MFGDRGVGDLQYLQKAPGLGIIVDQQLLEQMTISITDNY